MPDTFDRQPLATPTTQLVLPVSFQESSASIAQGNTAPEATQESAEETATVEANISPIKPTVLLCGRVEQVEGIATNMHIVNNIGRRQLKDLNTRMHGEVEDASVFWLAPKKYWTVSRKERNLQDTTLDIIATYLAENRDVVIVAPKEYRWCNRDPRKTLHRIDTAEHVVLCTRKLDKLKSLVGSSADEKLLHESIAVCLAQILMEDPLTVESAGRVGVRQSLNIEESDNDHKGVDDSRAKETQQVFTLKRNSKKKLPSAAQPKLSRSKTKKVESDEYDLGDHATNNDKPSEKPDYAKLVKKERQNKPVEKASDDCGDTVTAIELKESVEAFAAFFDDDDISTTCSNLEHESTLHEVSGQLYFGSVHELLEFVVRDESFDKVPPQADSDVSGLVSNLHLDNQNRPFFTYNWTPTNHRNHHIHMMEVFGGWGGCTRLAIRKKLRTGQNYDLTTGINLLDKAEVRKLHYYVDQYKPDVIVLAPPCTAFGRWSMYNRVHNWWAWSKSLEVGLPLANLAAALAAQQIKSNRFYIAENPWGSQLFELPSWQLVLRQSTMVCCDQCLFGLTDMDGWPTRKSTAFASNDESLISALNIRCQGQHSYHSVLAGSLHGTSKCSYAQSWPVQLCETIVNAIKRVLVRDGKIYLESSAREFVYVGEKSLSVCAGCRAHAYRGDPRHTRERGVCKFVDFESDVFSCPSCKRNQASHHPNHTRILGECHWAEAGTRSTSSSSRGPKAISHIIPDANPDVGSGSNPPETPLGRWYPLTDLSTIAAFDSVKNLDGWHTWYNNDQLLVGSNARSLREPQPRFENHLYNTRSVFALFVEHEHETGNWWQLEDHLPYMNKSRTLGYPVSILIQIFHVSIGQVDSVPPTEKESDVVDLDKPIGGTTTPQELEVPRRRVRINTTPEELAQPAEFGDEEIELPDVPVRRAAVEEVSESAIVPAEEKPEELVEWSTADLGNTLREMKSQDNSIVTRALRKLHIRWWHCSATRMRTILAQAGMPEKVLACIKDVCDTCRICRSWTRPSSKAMSHLTQAAGFNERVQLDLLFIDTYILVHLCDEATRFSMAEVIKTKEPCDILSGIKKAWVRVFGVPQIFISDSEGALGSEEASIWAERLGTSFKLLPKGSHATIVERHHETLRQLIHRISSQLKRENIVMSMDDICAEALVAKNCLLVINGVAPYTAVLGKLPNLLGEFERPPVSMLADDVGGSLSKHTSRLREVAIQQMVEGSAQERIKRAQTSQTRLSGAQLELVPGDLVDIYRTPRQKDNTGWRGPCTVVSTHGVEQGYLDVKWGGRTMACRIQDVRKALLYPALLRNRPDEYALDLLRQHVASMVGVTEIYSMINTQDGWQLSQAARSRPDLFHAFLKVAHDLFTVERCIGGRLGKGVARIPGMLDVSHTVLVWWPTNSPQLYKSMTCHGKLTLNLKELFGELWQEFAWIQCFGVNDEDVSRIRQRAPDIPYLGGERGDPRQEPQEPPAQPIPFDVDDEDMPHPRPDDDRSVATRIVVPTPTDRSRSSRHQSPFPSSNGPPAPPAPPPAPQQQRQKRTPTQTDRSRSTRGGESTLSTPQVTPVVSTQSTNNATANTETPELPDTPRGSKRSPTKSREAPPSAKKHYKDNRQERSQSQASSSNAPPTAHHEPMLPTHTENDVDDDDDDATVAYDNDQDTDLFSVDPWSSMYLQREAPRQYHGWELNPGLSDIVSHQEHYVANSETTTDKLQTRSSSMKDDKPEIEVGPAMAAWFVGVQKLQMDEILVFKSAGDNITSVQIEKNFDALTPAEVKQHYKLVETAIRKEIASFVEHKTFKRAFRKDCKNVCTSRWVLRWKDIDGQRCVKARLTIRGFQDMAEVPSFASTASRWGQRLIVSIASQKSWDLWVADVSTAFLRGLDFNELAKLTNSEVRDVAFVPPKGSERFFTELKGLHDLNFNTEVLKLMKAVYGLRDAPRAWRIRLDAELVKLGGVSLPTDRALYTFYDSANNLDALLSTHVDDLKGCGTSARVKAILAGLEKAFGKLKTSSLEKDGQFEHCGLKHEKIPSGGIRVHQDHYAAQLKCVDVTSLDITKIDQMLSPEFISLYLSLLGGLSWLIQTRTDIAVYVCALQRAASKATIGHLLKLNKITKWVRRKKIALVYKPLQKRGKVLVVSDSAFRTEPGSTLAVRGAIIGICEDDTNTPGGIFHILEFYSRKQRRVCRSTFAAELHAIADAVETARMVLLTITCCHKRYISPQELQKLEDTASLPLAMEVCTDCRSVFDSLAAQDLKTPSESSLVLILHVLKELLCSHVIGKITWIDTRDMVSDGLTKGAISRIGLMQMSNSGVWQLTHDVMSHVEKHVKHIVSNAHAAEYFAKLFFRPY
jgi:hypothetical protein